MLTWIGPRAYPPFFFVSLSPSYSPSGLIGKPLANCESILERNGRSFPLRFKTESCSDYRFSFNVVKVCDSLHHKSNFVVAFSLGSTRVWPSISVVACREKDTCYLPSVYMAFPPTMTSVSSMAGNGDPRSIRHVSDNDWPFWFVVFFSPFICPLRWRLIYRRSCHVVWFYLFFSVPIQYFLLACEHCFSFAICM